MCYLNGDAVEPGDDDECLAGAEGGVLVGVMVGALLRFKHHLVQHEARDVQHRHHRDDHTDLYLKATHTHTHYHHCNRAIANHTDLYLKATHTHCDYCNRTIDDIQQVIITTITQIFI